MADRYADFPDLSIERPSDVVVRITLAGPGRNAVSPAMPARLADVWLAVDRDPETRVGLLQGAGTAFSASGRLELPDAGEGRATRTERRAPRFEGPTSA